MIRGGLIRRVFHHPASQACVGLALLVHILVQLSPLWVPAVERRTGIEICTADGIRLVPAIPDPGAPSGKKKPAGECALCALHNAGVLAPSAIALTPCTGHFVSAALAGRDIDSGPQFAGANRRIRAPPVLS